LGITANGGCPTRKRKNSHFYEQWQQFIPVFSINTIKIGLITWIIIGQKVLLQSKSSLLPKNHSPKI
jgi:hypothetical protein